MTIEPGDDFGNLIDTIYKKVHTIGSTYKILISYKKIESTKYSAIIEAALVRTRIF